MNLKKLILLLFVIETALSLNGCEKQSTEDMTTVMDFPLSLEEQSEIDLMRESATVLSIETDIQTDIQTDGSLTSFNRASLLQNPCTVTEISTSLKNQSTANLDMDGDGTVEKIILEPSKNPSYVQYLSTDDPLAYYHLQIGNADFEGMGRNLINSLWAVSLDGKNILLILYEDGPSNDPYTYLFQYKDDKIIEIGGFADDIRQCKISAEGIISGTSRKDVVQTDYVVTRWQIGQDGMLEEILQDIYDFTAGNWVELVTNLPLHTTPKSAETFEAAPQKVRFLKTFADGSWLLIETENKQQGWIHLEDFNIVADLKKEVMEVFIGLNMTD